MPTVKLNLQQPYTKTTTGKRILSPKETRIYLFIIIGFKEVIKIKTPYVVLPKEWDFTLHLKNEKLAGAIEFNKKLRELKDVFLNKYDKTLKDHPDYSLTTISRILTEYSKTIGRPNKENKDFFAVLDEFIVSKEGAVTEGTVKKFRTLKASLQDFGTINKDYKNLEFSMINVAFKNAYRKYLRNRKPAGRQKTRPEELQYGLYTDTQAKYIECLKTFLKWAEEMNYNKHSIYRSFENFESADIKKKKQKNDIVTLTLQELKQFASFKFDKGSTFDHVRDLFCFSCYTGQRWGDVSRFDKQELHGDVWNFISDKTKEEMTIDLIGFAAPALTILNKYDFELPKISLTKFNFYIKKAVETAGIKAPTTQFRWVGPKEVKLTKPKYEWIGSHCARRTAVSILLNVYNVPVTHILQITGHSDLKTLQKYINPDREARREALSKTKAITETMTVVKKKAV
jgi:integrase